MGEAGRQTFQPEIHWRSRFFAGFINMFEQELYNDPTPVNSQDGDLFHNYEIRNWELGPRIYKILAASAIFNIAALAFVAQSDLLTRKGCDSPWAGRVCQVLDMAYVGTMLFGTERDFVDQEYEKIDLGDAEITFIDANLVSPPMDYPEGYFQIANPEQFEMLKQMQADGGFTSGFSALPPPVSSGSDLLAKAPELPKPNPNVVTGEIPDSPFSVGGNSDTSKQRFGTGRNRKKPPANTNIDPDQTVAQDDTNSNTNTDTTPPVSSAPVTDVDINKRPIADLGDFINDLKAKNQIDLKSEFVISAKGKLNDDGRLDPKTFRFINTSSQDPRMFEVVKSSVEALNVAGYLQYLKDVLGKDVAFTFQQDAENLSTVLQSDFQSGSHANTRKTVLDMLIAAWKLKKTNPNSSQNEKDDLTLLEGVTTEVKGKALVIRFVVPKEIAHPMIERKLAEQAAENLKKPNGIVNAAPISNTAAR